MAHRYGLIGRNISYSFSRKYFSEKFRNMGLDDHSYSNFDIPNIGEFQAVIGSTPDLKGLNVTIPYKEEVMAYLDELDPVAKTIGAVNTIKVCHGHLKGYNTDAFGFEHSLLPHLRESMKGALVLGTGGASKAIIYTLNKLGITPTRVSRTAKPGMITYEETSREIMEQHQIIINCTPLGTYPEVHHKPNLPYQYLTDKHLLYDLIYNPEETAFLKEGTNRGCTTLNGYKMLILQAEKAWEIWNR